MANNTAPRDGNYKATIQGVSSLDFASTTNIAVNPSTHAMLVEASLTPVALQDVNLTEVGGAAVALGNTTMSASLPVTIASNQTSFPVTIAAGSAVIGHVITDTGSTTAVTGTVTISGSVTQGTSPWIVAGGGTAGSAASGVITVQGIASMTPVQVSQSTGTNLHMVVDSGTITTITNPVAVTGTFWQATQPVSIASGGVASGAIASGAVASGAFASGSISDGANVTLGAKADAKSTATDTTAVTIMQVLKEISFMEQTPASRAVTNAGTFATQATLQTGSNAIGKLTSNSGVTIGAVEIAAAQTLATVTTVSTVSALGVSTTGPQKAEDVASAGGDMGILVMASRLDTPVANAGVSNDGDYTGLVLDNFRKLWVTGSVPEDTAHVAGEAISVTGSRRIDTLATSAGTSGDWATVNQTAEGGAWATLAPTATPNGVSVANFNSGDTYTALTATAQVIKASAGNLWGYYYYNPNAAATYILIYNIAAASVTVGTSTASMVFCIPASSAANVTFPYAVPFTNAGWSIAATTTGGGNTAPSTALEVMVYYT